MLFPSTKLTFALRSSTFIFSSNTVLCSSGIVSLISTHSNVICVGYASNVVGRCATGKFPNSSLRLTSICSATSLPSIDDFAISSRGFLIIDISASTSCAVVASVIAINLFSSTVIRALVFCGDISSTLSISFSARTCSIISIVSNGFCPTCAVAVVGLMMSISPVLKCGIISDLSATSCPETIIGTTDLISSWTVFNISSLSAALTSITLVTRLPSSIDTSIF